MLVLAQPPAEDTVGIRDFRFYIYSECLNIILNKATLNRVWCDENYLIRKHDFHIPVIGFECVVWCAQVADGQWSDLSTEITHSEFSF